MSPRASSAERQRASDERYRRIVESTSEGVVTIDAESRITYVNDRVTAMLGYTQQEMFGHSVFEFMDAEARREGLEKLERRRRGQAEKHEHRFLHRGGRPVWTEIHSNPLFTAAGVFEGSLAMITDISERRQYDELRNRLAAIVNSSDDAIIGKDLTGQITAWNHGAERMFGYSSAEVLGRSISILVPPDRQEEESSILARIEGGVGILHQETVRLRQDGTLIEKMEAVGNLAGGVAHDFNNLLSVILSLTSLAIEEMKPQEPLRADLEEIHAAAEKAAGLTRQLLAFSRQQILEPTVLDQVARSSAGGAHPDHRAR
jgi:PAS domain S-box-containing protein